MGLVIHGGIFIEPSDYLVGNDVPSVFLYRETLGYIAH